MERFVMVITILSFFSIVHAQYENFFHEKPFYSGSFGRYCILDTLRAKGLLFFTSPFSKAQGFGDGSFIISETPPTQFGKRPTLQGNGTLLRVNGLDAQSCNECHSVVKHSTFPPELGIGGVGGIVTTALISPTMYDVADNFDSRIIYQPGYNPDQPMAFDGICDYNGRVANPPFLFGGGGVEMLAKEMTVDLQGLLKKARYLPSGRVTKLITHCIDFGVILSLGGGEVDMSGVTGILPEDTTGHTPEEMLVVRPFGRKGDNFTMRDFDRGALQFHFGIQPVEVVGEGTDADQDGIDDEANVEQLSHLHIFGVTNPVPYIGKLTIKAKRGYELFQSIGCAYCHVPVLETRSSQLPLAHPENAEDPYSNVYRYIDLKKAGFMVAINSKGVQVPLFADLKRHKMGERLTESFEKNNRVYANDEFTTARLWGIADTKPYLHDGRATTITEAIDQLGGEAQAARDAFFALSVEEQNYVLIFLSKLHTPDKPNQELIDLAGSLAGDDSER
jgi:hypothetical protein